jgi:hypothetical protein
MKINSLPVIEGSSKIPTERRGEKGKLLHSRIIKYRHTEHW